MINVLSLANFLAFRKIDLDLRRLTVLSGTNSAGKTSVLHALALLRQSQEAQTLPGAWLLNGRWIELGTGRDLLHSEPAEVANIDGFALSIGLVADEMQHNWIALYEAAADVLQLDSSSTPDCIVPGLFGHGFQYLKADRLVPAVTYPKSHEAVSVHRTLGARGEHAPNYLRVWGETAIECTPATHPGGPSSTLLDQTNAWLADLSAGTSLDAVDVEGTDFVRLRFRRSGPEVRTETHRPTNVGFGLTYALPVVIGALMSSEHSLLLIENPEAHLHPRGQALVGRLCALAASGGAQVVVETHSDHVLNAVRLAVKRQELSADEVVLHFFSRSAGVLQPRQECIEIGANGMIDHWPQGFFDQWDEAVDELLDSCSENER